jgi:pyruvate-ferredoxin/flavodoxin oxidoreductase
MCAFFRLSGVIPLDVPLDDAVALLKAAIKKNYSYKGEDVVKNNIDLLDAVVSDPKSLILIDIPASWRSITDGDKAYENRHIALIDDEKVRKFMIDIAEPVSQLEGDDIPVSKFLEHHMENGTMIMGTSKYEKRTPNPTGLIPKWEPSNCTQCNQCVFVCPHAAIPPFVVTKDEAAAAPFPEKFETLKATGAELAGNDTLYRSRSLIARAASLALKRVLKPPKRSRWSQWRSGWHLAKRIGITLSSYPNAENWSTSTL